RTRPPVTTDGSTRTTGDLCKACEFRPWCNPLWQRQSEQPLCMHALTEAAQGFEGVTEMIEQLNGQWRLYVRWHGKLVCLVSPTERFPQLAQAHPGTRIRALDLRLQGNPYQPHATVQTTLNCSCLPSNALQTLKSTSLLGWNALQHSID